MPGSWTVVGTGEKPTTDPERNLVPLRTRAHRAQHTQRRSALARLNDYTLWAFNPQRVLIDPPRTREAVGANQR